MNTEMQATTPTDYPLWDTRVPLPSFDRMPDLDIVTHITVEKAQPDGYHYLHESSLAWHKGRLYVGWANHCTHEVNVTNECVRGRFSKDGGFTWSPAEMWAETPLSGSTSYNHPVIHSDGETLWGFFTRWDAEKPSTAIFQRDDQSGQWLDTGGRIPNFVPFRPPMQMTDGNWIISGEHFWHEAAVAISTGDFTAWQSIEIPRNNTDLLFPESTLLPLPDCLVAVMRPRADRCAPVSVSRDCGRTWTPMQPSNYPMAWSQPYGGLLSTGQLFLISNNREEERALLTIAVSQPGKTQFSHIWKLRHQQFPRRRLFGGYGGDTMVGQPTEWSYPAVVEQDSKLYISYTQGKEDCVLSIIPLSVLGG